MTNSDEVVAKKINDFVEVSRKLGEDTKSPDFLKKLAAKIAEIKLDEDYGLYSDPDNPVPETHWGPTDSRILRGIRLDTAEARVLTGAAVTYSQYAMKTSAKAYYVCLFLVMLNIIQILALWLLLR